MTVNHEFRFFKYNFYSFSAMRVVIYNLAPFDILDRTDINFEKVKQWEFIKTTSKGSI
jgi:hypothetical protein